jgi:Zn-dependent membrane protease YugP
VTLTLWLLFLAPLALALGAQGLVQAVFRRYRTVPNHSGVTGAEVARALLDAHGLRDVRIELVPGFLTDHYDGDARALRLSGAVASERSVAALGIAAHEVSHAYQDAEGSRAYRARHSIGEQLAQIAPWSGIFLIGGFWFGIPVLVALSLLFVGGLVVFALATLPVEIGASHRGLMVLRQTDLADDAELRGVRRVLRAAAVTYVVGLLDRLAFFLLLLFLAEAARRAAAA